MSTLLMRLRQLPQLVQFGLVGGSAAATPQLGGDLVVAHPGQATQWGKVQGVEVAFIVSYNGHAALTFSQAQARGWATVARFFAVACGSFVANELLYAAALRWLPWNYLASLALVLVLVAAGTFVLSKFWAFKAAR